MSVKIRIVKLNEATDRQVQDEFVATMILNIRQDRDIDRTEALGFIRAIPNVSTVRREREISTTEQTYVGEFNVRIILKHGQSISKYINSVLKPSISNIDGVSLQDIINLEKVS